MKPTLIARLALATKGRLFAVCALLSLCALAVAQGSGGAGFDFLTLAKAAVQGFVAAFTIDINAWCRSTPKGTKNLPFDWSLALKRWLSGAAMGAAASMGWDVAIRF